MSVNKRAVDRLISYYANVPLGPRPVWPDCCIGAVLRTFKPKIDSYTTTDSIAAALAITHEQATKLFYLEDAKGVHQMGTFQRHKDPAGWIIGILEHLRDTGEVFIPAA